MEENPSDKLKTDNEKLKSEAKNYVFSFPLSVFSLSGERNLLLEFRPISPDRECRAELLDVEEEYLAVGRECRAGELGTLHVWDDVFRHVRHSSGRRQDAKEVFGCSAGADIVAILAYEKQTALRHQTNVVGHVEDVAIR